MYVPRILASSSPEVTAAIIAAGASLLVALVTAVLSQRNSLALKRLEAAQAESNARIAYNYEARKRLYTVCEPLLFQAMEQAEDARSRIASLAKCARTDKLRADGTGWLVEPERYYFKSIVYGLLAPITTFSVLQRRLTTIDLGLDPDVRAKYELLRLVFFSFCQDWDLAAYGKEDEHLKLDYDRNKTDAGEPGRARLLRDSPAHYAPQGFYRAMVYVIAESLITEPQSSSASDPLSATARCMSFGAFQREWDQAASESSSRTRQALHRVGLTPRSQSAMTPVFEPVVELFKGFHPKRKPVLWRVLLTQYLLYGALLSGEPSLHPLSAAERTAIDWCRDGEDNAGEMNVSVTVAERFVGDQLASLQARVSR